MPSGDDRGSIDPAEVAGLASAHARILDAVRRAATRSDRDPATIELVAVSKTIVPDRLRAAVAAGIDLFGENRVQEAASKAGSVDGARWHLIGPLQSNKARRAVDLFAMIQTVDTLELAVRLDRLAAEVRPGERLAVLLQANVDADPAKAGFDPDRLATTLPELLALDRLDMRGLMTVGRQDPDPEAARPTFRRLRELSARLRAIDPRLGPGLSMGMSDDYPIAIEEGATIIRVGRALFGDRPAPRGPIPDPDRGSG